MAIKISGSTIIDDSRNIGSAGIVTATSFVGDVTGSLTGNATGLSGTPDLNVGVVTATSFVGNVTGTASTATAAGTAYGLEGTPNISVGIATVGTTLRVNGNYVGDVNAVGALDIDCSQGNYFTKTISGDSTFTVSNVPTSSVYAFTLELTHTSGNITWFSGVEWPASTTPTLTTGKTHLFIFVTDDGGSRWRAASLVDYTN